MKIPRVLLIGIALLFGAFVVAGAQAASIVGSLHDMTATSWGAGGQICVYCHAPHNTQASTIAPLWNHGSTSATFTPYSSSTLNATVGQPDGYSKACLSCHDGTVAIDTYGTQTGTHSITSGTKFIGTDLSNDHPVSFTYDAALATADGGLVSPTSASLVVTGIPLYAGKMQCSSCHAVHDPVNGHFLRVNNAASALCLKCHAK